MFHCRGRLRSFGWSINPLSISLINDLGTVLDFDVPERPESWRVGGFFDGGGRTFDRERFSEAYSFLECELCFLCEDSGPNLSFIGGTGASTLFAETGKILEELLILAWLFFFKLPYVLNQAQEVTGPCHIWFSPLRCRRRAKNKSVRQAKIIKIAFIKAKALRTRYIAWYCSVRKLATSESNTIWGSFEEKHSTSASWDSEVVRYIPRTNQKTAASPRLRSSILVEIGLRSLRRKLKTKLSRNQYPPPLM